MEEHGPAMELQMLLETVALPYVPSPKSTMNDAPSGREDDACAEKTTESGD